MSAIVAALNAVLPPLLAALKLPFTLVAGFLLVLLADALMLLAADEITDNAIHLDSFWIALLVALVASAVIVVLEVITGSNDEDTYTIRVIQRLARRSGERVESDQPGIVFLEIDGLALPILRSAMRDGNAPHMASWMAEHGYALTEWEPDLSSQTGASQAGILLGSNEDIPAFRWVEKETGLLMTCSAPPDCAEIERRRGDGDRASHQRRREPRQPPLRRGRPRHPHRQPDGGGEEGEPRLPRLLRERVQRDPVARALLLGGRPRDHLLRPAAPARRPAARPPRRHLPVHARGDVRGRPRPDRLRRPHGHDEGPPRDLRDLLQLRRGRASLRARAHRHAGGTAQARRAVRAHRARPAVRAAAVRDRRPLGSRADAGRDLQAAQRLRARRARRDARSRRER